MLPAQLLHIPGILSGILPDSVIHMDHLQGKRHSFLIFQQHKEEANGICPSGYTGYHMVPGLNHMVLLQKGKHFFFQASLHLHMIEMLSQIPKKIKSKGYSEGRCTLGRFH